ASGTSDGPAGAGVVAAPVAGEDRQERDRLSLDRGVHHQAVAGVDADVRDRLARRFVRVGEEDQVARPELVAADPGRRVVLLLGGPGERDADLAVAPLGQAAAVEPRG